jgi:hypothetical protein
MRRGCNPLGFAALHPSVLETFAAILSRMSAWVRREACYPRLRYSMFTRRGMLLVTEPVDAMTSIV